MLGPFEPTWRRALLAFAIAAAAFLTPQEAPLVWYPLNHPSDVYYLEITCRASAEGETRISFDTGAGFNDLQMIRIPIAPSTQPYTYTFPLWDAPLQGLMLQPLDKPGSLIVTNMRITTRSGREIKRFTGDDFDATHEISRIAPLPKGWEFVTTPDARRPYSMCGFFPPIIPDGMNARNFLRCVLSWSYLGLMLWILLLAVYLVLRRPESGDKCAWEDGAVSKKQGGAVAFGPRPPVSGLRFRTFFRESAFLAFIALLFAGVGNRGLIRDSIRDGRFPADPIKPGLRLEFDLSADPPRAGQLFWDTGHGFNGVESARIDYAPNTLYQTIRFALPNLKGRGERLHALRFNPFDTAGAVHIFGIRVVDKGRRTRMKLPTDCLKPERDIASITVQDSETVIRTTPSGRDPILEFTPDAVEAIARILTEEKNGGDS